MSTIEYCRCWGTAISKNSGPRPINRISLHLLCIASLVHHLRPLIAQVSLCFSILVLRLVASVDATLRFFILKQDRILPFNSEVSHLIFCSAVPQLAKSFTFLSNLNHICGMDHRLFVFVSSGFKCKMLRIHFLYSNENHRWSLTCIRSGAVYHIWTI